ncbi:MAG: hypothetical protein ABJN75_13220 [Hoeflea sp.]|uniref:hypothetical protein n=1 Tax=Hoeflea sp. TaxID=1940281 RepID=UPI00329759F0
MKATMILSAIAISAPQDGPMIVKSAQFAIKSPASTACPAPEKSTAWSFTSIPGTVSYMVVRKGGSVSGRFKARPSKPPRCDGHDQALLRGEVRHQCRVRRHRFQLGAAEGELQNPAGRLVPECHLPLAISQIPIQTGLSLTSERR